jgi:hypothetical protein
VFSSKYDSLRLPRMYDARMQQRVASKEPRVRSVRGSSQGPAQPLFPSTSYSAVELPQAAEVHWAPATALAGLYFD